MHIHICNSALIYLYMQMCVYFTYVDKCDYIRVKEILMGTKCEAPPSYTTNPAYISRFTFGRKGSGNHQS